MMKKIILVFLFVLVLFLPISVKAQEHIIVDSDMSTDTDDLVAVRICQEYNDKGLISFDALMLSDENTLYQGRTAAEGILDAYGFKNVIVGTSTNPNLETNLPYWGWLSSQKSVGHSCDTSVRQYRRLLSSGGTYGIVVIGYFDNIWNLLKSQPDDISNETGMQLVAEHVDFFDVCGVGKGNQGDAKQYSGFENNTCFYNSSYTASSQFYKCIGALNIPIYQYTGEKYLAAVVNVGGKDKLPENDVVYKAFNGAGRYDGGPGYDAICAWLLYPILTNTYSNFGIVPQKYRVESTWDPATRFESVQDINGNVTMLNMTLDSKTYKAYIQNSY